MSRNPYALRYAGQIDGKFSPPGPSPFDRRQSTLPKFERRAGLHGAAAVNAHTLVFSIIRDNIAAALQRSVFNGRPFYSKAYYSFVPFVLFIRAVPYATKLTAFALLYFYSNEQDTRRITTTVIIRNYARALTRSVALFLPPQKKTKKTNFVFFAADPRRKTIFRRRRV